jgi:predicted HTH domain antitoxin
MSEGIENKLTLTQKYILLLLEANNSEPITGKVWFQKELFLVAQNIPRLESEADFEGSLMGPYSENANAELDQLRIEGLVHLNGKICLTIEGKNAAQRVKVKASQQTKEILEEMKSFINDLSEDEMLAFVYASYPTMTEESILWDEIKQKRIQLAISLYAKNKLSLGKAAFVAGISQEDFLEKAKALGIRVFSE